MSVAFYPDYNYQVGGSLPVDAPTYVRRKADADLYTSLKRSEFCYVLNARQMGKSSLRVQTMHQLQAGGIVCAAIDLTEIGTSQTTPEEWYAGLIDGIASRLNLYEFFDLETWWFERNLLSYVQRFSKFIEEVLLHSIPQNIVIFLEEIDSTLSLKFGVEGFFAVIRECYNNRADKVDYRRLTFVTIGVAAPSDLMHDKQRTPFNIGRAIELTGFWANYWAMLWSAWRTDGWNRFGFSLHPTFLFALRSLVERLYPLELCSFSRLRHGAHLLTKSWRWLHIHSPITARTFCSDGRLSSSPVLKQGILILH